MRFWKLVIYTKGEDYETREFFIDEPTFRQYQEAIVGDKEFIIMKDRVIKRSMIKEILPADTDIKEYLDQGSTLAQLGLPERTLIEENKTKTTIELLWDKK